MSTALEDLYQGFLDRIRADLAAQPLPRRFLSKDALADHLGVSERTVKTWRAKGLPACKVGRELMFDIEAVNRWIERYD
jgi:excisionase family DNA binding protein